MGFDDSHYRLTIVKASDRSEQGHLIPKLEEQFHELSAYCKCVPAKKRDMIDERQDIQFTFVHRVMSHPIN